MLVRSGAVGRPVCNVFSLYIYLSIIHQHRNFSKDHIYAGSIQKARLINIQYVIYEREELCIEHSVSTGNFLSHLDKPRQFIYLAHCNTRSLGNTCKYRRRQHTQLTLLMFSLRLFGWPTVALYSSPKMMATFDTHK